MDRLYRNNNMLENGNIRLYIFQIIITGSFACLAIWLFANIRYENRDKKWFRLIFDGKEWTPVIKSMALPEDISEFKGG